MSGLADLARREKLWFHIDGAYGALAMLAPELAPRLRGIERADSLAFDFHKWGQVPYDAGFLLVRDGALHRNAFAASSAYLRRETRGLAAGSPWPCDYGPDLSRGFRALKTWFTLKVYGTAAIGAAISRTCALARYLEGRIASTPELELLAPVELNIVCFRYRSRTERRSKRIEREREIAIELQESGSVAPSTTILGGRLAIRAAIVNHRTGQAEIDRLVERTLELGRGMVEGKRGGRPHSAAAWRARRSTRVRWEAELQQVESELAANPESVDLRFRRACLTGRTGPAGGRHETITSRCCEREPYHLAALNNLGKRADRRGPSAGGANRVPRSGHAASRRSHQPRAISAHFLLEESERLTTQGEDEKSLRTEARSTRAVRTSPAG